MSETINKREMVKLILKKNPNCTPKGVQEKVFKEYGVEINLNTANGYLYSLRKNGESTRPRRARASNSAQFSSQDVLFVKDLTNRLGEANALSLVNLVSKS